MPDLSDILEALGDEDLTAGQIAERLAGETRRSKLATQLLYHVARGRLEKTEGPDRHPRNGRMIVRFRRSDSSRAGGGSAHPDGPPPLS